MGYKDVSVLSSPIVSKFEERVGNSSIILANSETMSQVKSSSKNVKFKNIASVRTYDLEKDPSSSVGDTVGEKIKYASNNASGTVCTDGTSFRDIANINDKLVSTSTNTYNGAKNNDSVASASACRT